MHTPASELGVWNQGRVAGRVLARRTLQARLARPRSTARGGSSSSARATGPTPQTAVLSVPELFGYWLQGGRIDVGFLGAAQIDRHGNLNSTVIGPYERPKVRLPGAGGAPEIATSVRDVFVLLRQSPRSFVDKIDFVSSVGARLWSVGRRWAGRGGKRPG